jgi:hypothetical protein
VDIPESTRRCRRGTATRLDPSSGTARRMRSGVIRRPPENFGNVEDLTREDGGQGVLLNRNQQGLWTDLSPPGAAGRERRSRLVNESGNREGKTDRRDVREAALKFDTRPDNRTRAHDLEASAPPGGTVGPQSTGVACRPEPRRRLCCVITRRGSQEPMGTARIKTGVTGRGVNRRRK